MAKNAAVSTATGSFPILGILGLIFITLKLTGYIAWSWWYVTLPFWGPFVAVIGIVLAVLLVSVIASVAKAWIDKRRRARNPQVAR
jgi:hypothetical protein